MSLDVARSIAVSGLMATQVQMTVTSSNISNADTTGYTVKTATQSSVVTGGVGTGVTVTGISSSVDKLLFKSLISATWELGAADTTNTYLNQLQALFGTTGSTSASGTSLADALTSLQTAISSLSSTPDSESLQSNVVSALDSVASQLRDTSSGIQKLRKSADQEITSSVDDINQSLKQIASLNAQIRQAAASGQSTADLEDQRNTALQNVSSYMNVSYFTASNGDLQVYTTSGQALVDSTAHTISHSTASNVTSSTTFDGITVNGVDITSQITSGKIGALINLRDNVLPASQSQLDNLAQTLASTLNDISNQGTSYPAPTTLTGTAAVSASDAFSATGTARIAVVDQSGNVVSYQDLDLSSYSSVGDVVNALNSITGVSASIDSSGHLTISATGSGNGIAINEMDSSVGASGAGFSSAFGLNDIVTGTGAANFSVRSNILNNSGLLQVGTLSSSSTLSAGSAGISQGSSTMVNAFYDALNASQSFGSVSGLGSTTSSLTDYAAAIVANVASKASSASQTYSAKQASLSNFSNSLSSQSGVNIDEETARLSTLQNKYTAASAIIQAVNAMFSSLMTAVQSTS